MKKRRKTKKVTTTSHPHPQIEQGRPPRYVCVCVYVCVYVFIQCISYITHTKMVINTHTQTHPYTQEEEPLINHFVGSVVNYLDLSAGAYMLSSPKEETYTHTQTREGINWKGP